MSGASSLGDYLDHMLEAARLACSYTEGIGKEQFLADRRTQPAVIMNLVIIGHTVTKLLKDNADFLVNVKHTPTCRGRT
jgi:uncharacterized protein with HEPN domain